MLTDDRLSNLLDIWSEWMRGKQGPKGFGTRAHVGSSTSSTDLEEMCAEMDFTQARAVDAEIESLPRNERIAVHHAHLATVWRLREDMATVYARARQMLCDRLQRRGIE